MRAPSYFYSVEHASRKSFYNLLKLRGSSPPYMDKNGLPGKMKFNKASLKLHSFADKGEGFKQPYILKTSLDITFT